MVYQLVHIRICIANSIWDDVSYCICVGYDTFVDPVGAGVRLRDPGGCTVCLCGPGGTGVVLGDRGMWYIWYAYYTWCIYYICFIWYMLFR